MTLTRNDDAIRTSNLIWMYTPVSAADHESYYGSSEESSYYETSEESETEDELEQCMG